MLIKLNDIPEDKRVRALISRVHKALSDAGAQVLSAKTRGMTNYVALSDYHLLTKMKEILGLDLKRIDKPPRWEPVLSDAFVDLAETAHLYENEQTKVSIQTMTLGGRVAYVVTIKE